MNQLIQLIRKLLKINKNMKKINYILKFNAEESLEKINEVVKAYEETKIEELKNSMLYDEYEIEIKVEIYDIPANGKQIL